jgi:hypothetical protein
MEFFEGSFETELLSLPFFFFPLALFATHATKKRNEKCTYYLATSEESEYTTTQTLDD